MVADDAGIVLRSEVRLVGFDADDAAAPTARSAPLSDPRRRRPTRRSAATRPGRTARPTFAAARRRDRRRRRRRSTGVTAAPSAAPTAEVTERRRRRRPARSRRSDRAAVPAIDAGTPEPSPPTAAARARAPARAVESELASSSTWSARRPPPTPLTSTAMPALARRRRRHGRGDAARSGRPRSTVDVERPRRDRQHRRRRPLGRRGPMRSPGCGPGESRSAAPRGASGCVWVAIAAAIAAGARRRRRRRRRRCSMCARSRARRRLHRPGAAAAVVDELRGDAILLVADPAGRAPARGRCPGSSAPAVDRRPAPGVRIDIRERNPVATVAGADGGAGSSTRDGRVWPCSTPVARRRPGATWPRHRRRPRPATAGPARSGGQRRLGRLARPPAERDRAPSTESIGVDAHGRRRSTLQLARWARRAARPSTICRPSSGRLLSHGSSGLDGSASLDVSTA